MYSRRNRNKKGAISGLVLLLSIIVTILGMSMLAVGQQLRIKAVRTTEQMGAHVAADAGLTKVMDDLNTAYKRGKLDKDNLPAAKQVTIPNFAGTYTYSVTENSGEYTITSQGNYGTGQKTISAKLETSGLSYAVLVKESFYMKNNGIITGSCGTLSTNDEAIEIDKGIITGDAFCGVGGDPDDVIDCTVGGEQYALEAPITLEEVSVPDSAKKAGPNKNWNSPKNYTLGIPGTTTYVRYTGITISGTLNISGDVVMYVDGDLSDVGSGINVKDDSSLELYITGDFGPGGNGVDLSSSNGDPSVLRIYGIGTSTQTLVLGKNKATTVGCVYAPKANVTIGKNKAVFIGQITANSFNCKNSADIVFDSRAADVNPVSGGELTLTSWYE